MGMKARTNRLLKPIILGSSQWSLSGVDDIAFFPDCKKIAVVSTSGAVCVFSPKGDVIARWDIPVSTLCQSVAVSPDGDTIVVGSSIQGQRPVVCVFSLKSGRRRDLKGHQGDSCPNIAINSSGTRALSGDDDGTLRLWDLNTGKRIKSWGVCKPYTITSVAMTSCGSALFAVYGSGITRFDMTTGEKVRFKGGAHSIALSSNGAQLASIEYRSAAIRIWDLTTETALPDMVPSDENSAQVNTLPFCPDGRFLAAYDDGKLRLWDVEQNRVLRTFTGHTDSACALDISADGKLAVSAGTDSTIRVWEVSTGQEVTATERLSGPVCAVAPANGGVLAIHAGKVSSIVHWPEFPSDTPNLLARADKGLVTSAWIAADSSRVVLVTADSLNEYHLASDQWTQHKIVRRLIEVATSNDDSKKTFTGSESLWLREVARGQTLKLRDRDGHLRAVLGFSHDGKQIVSTGYYSGSMKLWDAASGSLVRAWNKGPSSITTIAFTQDDSNFLTGGFRGFDLWSPAKAKPVVRIKTASVLQILVDDEGTVHSLSDDGIICKWEMGAQRVIASRSVDGEPNCFSVRDQGVIVGHADTTISVIPSVGCAVLRSDK